MGTGHPLDNVVWHAIVGPRASFASRTAKAGRFHPDVGPFAAICDQPDGEAWTELAGLLQGHIGVLFRMPVEVPPSWEVVQRMSSVQMVAEEVAGRGAPEAEELGPADVEDMLGLIERARPGPFGRRTVELGGYIGVRDGGQLIAMAGERLRCDGYTEISAVCTAETHRGKGLATSLVLALVDRIHGRGEQAFLHADVKNETAIRLYQALGFRVRTHPEVTLLRAPAPSGE